jgi:hypothetical protein
MTAYNLPGAPPGMGDWGVLTADVDAALAGIEGVDGDRDLLEIVRALHRCAWIADRVVCALRDIGRGVA